MTTGSKAALAVIIAFLCALSGCSQSQGMTDSGAPIRKVLLIARESSADMALMIDREVRPIIHDLTAKGFDVTVASDSGKDITSGLTTLKADMSLASVNVADYAGLIIPCMAAGGSENEIPPMAVQIVSQANARGIPIAAEQSGVQILGTAGVLKGKNYAIAPGAQNASWGGTCQGAGVVVDGTLVTSGTCPYMEAQDAGSAGTQEMTTDFIALLSKP